MSHRKHGFASDIAFICMLVLLFICIIFMTTYSDALSMNSIIFIAMCLVMIITYFTTLTTGFIIDIVIIFGGASWLLYRLAVQDIQPEQEVYFWLVMLVLLTLAVGVMSRGVRSVEAENERMSKELESNVTIDNVTGLKNRYSYETEMPVYTNIAIRNDVAVVLLVLEFRYAGEMKTYMGAERLQNVSVKLSQMLDSTLRTSDTVYLLSTSPYRWGALLLLKPGSEKIVMDRLRKSVADMDFTEDRLDIQPEVRMGAGQGIEHDTPQQLLERAINNMEYDV